MARPKPLDVHRKCPATRLVPQQLTCGKSKGHTDSQDPQHRRHYDADRDTYWSDADERESSDE